MISFAGSIDIGCPPRAVFDYLCDPANAPEWQSGVVQSTVTSPGPIGPGTHFEETVRVGLLKVRAACEVTEYERDRRLGFRADSGPLGYGGTYLFEPDDGDTRLTVRGEGTLRGWWRLLEPMLAADVKRQSREELERIKRIVEERARAGTGDFPRN